MRIRPLGVLGIIFLGLATSTSALAQTLANGAFASGDLTGWSANSVDGGTAAVVRQGTAYSTAPGADQTPFPEGPGTYAAGLRATASPTSVGILTSDPFVPRSSRLAFYTLSESGAVAPKVLILTAGADPVNPSVSDLLLIQNVSHDSPGAGPAAAFQRQEVDLSSVVAAGQAIRVQFRQPSTASGAGFFTLVTDVDDTGQPPATVSPAAVTDLSVSATSGFSVTLSFNSPKDTGFGSVGHATSYDVRYSLSPITEENFSSAAPLAGPPAPSQAGVKESIEVMGLEPVQSYYFAVRSSDGAGNSSPISNVVNAVTSSPVAGGPGLTAQYFSLGATASLPPERATLFSPDRLIDGGTRIEPGIDIDYEKSRPPSVPHDRFGVRYTGQIVPKFSENYTFCTTSDDGTRFWISEGAIDPSKENPLISHWVEQSVSDACGDHAVALTAGTKYNLIEEYFQDTGPAVNRLLWGSPSQPTEPIPPSALLSTDVPVPHVGRLTGAVLLPDGSPAAGFLLHLTPASGAASDVTTDNSGTYTVVLAAGEYHYSGESLTLNVPAATPPVTVAPDTLTTAPPVTLGAPEAQHLGLVNGNFATGDLTGWTPTGYDGGLVQLEQNGKEYFGPPVPNPDGGNAWAVDVRSWDDPLHLGDTSSTGILLSDPFIPNAATLTFWTHSQSKSVAPLLLLLKLTADPIQPKPDDILLSVKVRNDFPGQGSKYSYEMQTVDISTFYNALNPTQGTPMRLEARQHTTENYFGWYTLFTDFDAGPLVPVSGLLGDLNYDGQVNVGDAIVGLQVVVGLLPVTPDLVRLGDVSPKRGDGTYGDGAIAVDDVVRILRRVVGLEPDPWP